MRANGSPGRGRAGRGCGRGAAAPGSGVHGSPPIEPHSQPACTHFTTKGERRKLTIDDCRLKPLTAGVVVAHSSLNIFLTRECAEQAGAYSDGESRGTR